MTVGTIPASRVLRRRAAAEDLVDDHAGGDEFWAGVPRLYDFSQQHQQQPPRPPSPPASLDLKPCLPALQQRQSPRPPSLQATRRSPSPPPEQKPSDPCLSALQQQLRHSPPRPPSPPAARRSPSPEVKPCDTCLVALQRSCVGWGATKSIAYYRRRHDARGGCRALVQAGVVVLEPRAVGDEEASGARKIKWLEEVAAAEEWSRDDKSVVVKADRSRNRKSTRSCLRPRRDADRRASKKVPSEAVKMERAASRKRASSGRARRRGAAKHAKKTPRVKEDNEEGSSGDKKRKRPDDEKEEAAAAEEESSRVKSEVVKTETTRSGRRRNAAKKTPGVNEEDEEKSKPDAPAPTCGSPRDKVVRWSAPRYAACEAALLDILRARGATTGKPLPRAELRAAARRHIGDTGLLDHLLRHAADKVPPGSAERIRRRYSRDGSLEYWLEPAGLAAVRREAGVDDLYWVPPPGWKLGDPVSPEDCQLAVKKKVEGLAGELAVVKRSPFSS